jgi:hypothetical protein
MTISSILLGVGLALLSAFLIARPFYRHLSQPAAGRGEGERQSLLGQKAAIYAAIREIDTDVQVGKLELADHRTLRQQYVAEGVMVLRALDALPAGDEIDVTIEADVARWSQGESLASDGAFCPACGGSTDPDDKFCAKCGAQLRG